MGWQSVFVSEIEAAPSAVLAHHYPDVPNLGDFTKIDGREYYDLDVLLASTPCQAFSVAGLRKSISDERGNLTLEFTKLVERINPRVTLWENVPGVLSTADNAFGCFLGGLVGADSPLVCPRGLKWSNAGYAAGPRRKVAWRVLDAQGDVPQRRRRVFVLSVRNDLRLDPRRVLFETEAEVVGGLGDCAGPEEVFLKLQSLRWDTSSRGEAGQDPAEDAGDGAEVRGIEIGPSGGGFTDLSCTLDARCKDGAIRNQIGMLAGVPETVGTLSDGAHNGGGSTDRMPTREESSRAMRMTAFGEYVDDETASTIKQRDFKDATDSVVVGGSFDPQTQYGDIAGTLTARHDSSPCEDRRMNVVAFSAKDHGADAAPEPIAFQSKASASQSMNPNTVSPACDVGKHDGLAVCYAVRTAQTSANGHGVAEEVSHTLDGAQGQAIVEPFTLAIRGRGGIGVGAVAFEPRYYTRDNKTGGAPADTVAPLTSENHAGDSAPHVAAPIAWSEELTAHVEMAGTVQYGGQGGRHDGVMTPQMAVRRLTPRECERLQNWPDDYTLVERNGKEMADGPRYKMVGNGWCSAVVVRICQRIENLVAEHDV